MSCFTTGSPGKEHRTNKPPPTRRVQKETPHVRPPSRILLAGIHLGWTRRVPPGRALSQNDWLKTTRKLIPSHKTRDRESCGRAVLLVPLPYCSQPRCPFPIKSLALSAHVSPQTIHLWVSDKSPVLGPGKGPPSCNCFLGKHRELLIWRHADSWHHWQEGLLLICPTK